MNVSLETPNCPLHRSILLDRRRSETLTNKGRPALGLLENLVPVDLRWLGQVSLEALRLAHKGPSVGSGESEQSV